MDQVRESEAAFESGVGSTLVLLHGLGGTWHIWKPVIGLLSKRHRVVALTLPGHLGGPQLPDGVDPTVDSLADELAQDLQRRGIERPHVVGNSLGGWLALELLRRGRVSSVTALSPAGGWSSPEAYKQVEKPFRIVFALIAVLMFLSALFLRFAAVRRALNKQAMEHGDRMPVPEFRGAMNSLRHTHMLPRLLTNMREHGPIRPLDAGKVPVTIAWCEHDRVIPFETYGRPMLAAVQGAEARTLHGVGHVPMYDDPEQVAEVILHTTARAEAPASAEALSA